MRDHIHAVGLLHAIVNALGVLIGVGIIVFSFLAASVAGAAVGSGQGAAEGGIVAALAGVTGTIVGLVFLVPALPGFVGGLGVLRRRSWARWVLVVVSVLILPGFPIWTALGGYSLWALLSPRADDYFRGEPPLSY